MQNDSFEKFDIHPRNYHEINAFYSIQLKRCKLVFKHVKLWTLTKISNFDEIKIKNDKCNTIVSTSSILQVYISETARGHGDREKWVDFGVDASFQAGYRAAHPRQLCRAAGGRTPDTPHLNDSVGTRFRPARSSASSRHQHCAVLRHTV